MRKFSTNDLIDYAEGQLDDAAADDVRKWLAANPEATRLVASWQATRAICRLDDSVAPPASLDEKLRAIFQPSAAEQAEPWFSRLQHVIASLTFDSRLQPLAVRHAGSDRVELTFAAGAAEVDLQCTRQTAGPREQWTCLGQVVAESTAHARIALCEAGAAEPIVETSANERGIFELQCASGQFELIIEMNGTAVRTPVIELN